MEHTIIGFDIKDYSQLKTESDMKSARNILYEIIESAVEEFIDIKKGFNDKEKNIEQGDGCFFFVDSGDYKSILVFMTKVIELSKNSAIRFRGAVHRGIDDESVSFNHTGKTIIGNGINCFSRYINSPELKQLLELNPEVNFVYGISDDFYNCVKKEEFFSDKEKFFKAYNTSVKKFSGKIFLNIQDVQNFPAEKKELNFNLSASFSSFLKKAEFVYPGKETKLDSLFIYPELSLRNEASDEFQMKKIDSFELIENWIKNPSNMLITGDMQCGKTSLAKEFFNNIFKSENFIPIFEGFKQGIQVKLLKNLIDTKLIEIYGLKLEDIQDFDSNIVFIFDDFSNIKESAQEKLINTIREQYPNSYTIIFTDALFLDNVDNLKFFNDYDFYEIRSFGHKKRYELIERWIDFTDTENPNYESTDELNSYVDNTLVKGLIPYFPFFILTILLAKKNFTTTAEAEKITSKAYCYQTLVYLNLTAMGIKDSQIRTYLNLFSYIAYHLFSNGFENLLEEELLELLRKYSNEYNLADDMKDLLVKFNKSNIFSLNSMNAYSFVNKYSYYYFLGRYLAKNANSKKVEIQNIFDNIDVSSNFFIALFVTHHIDDSSFFDTICKKSATLFNQYKESSLTKEELSFFDDEFKRVQKVVIEKLDNSRQIRVHEAEEKDKYEENEDSEVEDETVPDTLSDMFKSIRTVELLGQVIKNHGDLPKTSVIKYFTNGMNNYRRICDYFLSTFRDNKGSFIEYIEYRLSKLDDSSKGKATDMSYKIFAAFCFSAIIATVYRITDALGDRDLIKIVKGVYEKDSNPLTYCVYLQCQLWYGKTIPLDELKEKYSDFPDTIKYLIMQIMKDYTDKHKIDVKTKQKIASCLGMKVERLNYDYEK